MQDFLCGKLPKPADKVGEKAWNTPWKIVVGGQLTMLSQVILLF